MPFLLPKLVWSKRRLSKVSPGTIHWTESPKKNNEKGVLLNPSLRFTKTTDVFTAILGFKGRGLLNESQFSQKILNYEVWLAGSLAPAEIDKKSLESSRWTRGDCCCGDCLEDSRLLFLCSSGQRHSSRQSPQQLPPAPRVSPPVSQQSQQPCSWSGGIANPCCDLQAPCGFDSPPPSSVSWADPVLVDVYWYWKSDLCSSSQIALQVLARSGFCVSGWLNSSFVLDPYHHTSARLDFHNPPLTFVHPCQWDKSQSAGVQWQCHSEQGPGPEEAVHEQQNW